MAARPRPLPCVLAATAALLAAPGAAVAQGGRIVTSAPATSGNGTAVVGATGAAGGLLTGAAPAIGAQLGQVLGAGGVNRPGTSPPPPESGGSSAPPPDGQASEPGPVEGEVLEFATASIRAWGPFVFDPEPPVVTARVLSTLRETHRRGRIRLLLRLDEPGVVFLRSVVRPGPRRRAVRGRHSRALVRVPPAILAFRRRGSLTVSVRVNRAGRRTLGRARNGRLQLIAVAVDGSGNQSPVRRKLHLRR